MPVSLSKFQKHGIILLILALIVALGYAMQHTLSCLLLSFVLAYLLDPFVKLLEKWGIRRIYGILVLYTVLIIASIFCFTYLLPLMTERWGALVRDIPGYFQQIKKIALELKARFGLTYATNEWSWIVDSVQAGLDRILGHLGAGVYATVTSVVFNLFNLLLAPILVFFMLYYKQEALTGIVRWLPAENKDFLVGVGREINRSIGGYIRGQVIVSLIVALLSTVSLIFLGVNHPIFSGIFAGLASVIPFIGVILATLPPLFFAYVEFQSGILLLQVVIVFSVIYFFEGYVIKPLVFKESMDLNPLVTIIMIMAMGELIGFWGIILAIPIAAAIKIYCNHLRAADEDAL